MGQNVGPLGEPISRKSVFLIFGPDPPLMWIIHQNRGGEIHPLKISKSSFRDGSMPKRSTQWPNFLIGFGGHVHFPAKNVPKKIKNQNIIITSISHHQSIDNMITAKVFSPNDPKMAELWPKTYVQIWACSPYLGHNLVKYQYFWMKTALLYVYQYITYYLWFIAWFMFNCMIMNCQKTSADYYLSICDDKSKLWCLFLIFCLLLARKWVATTRLQTRPKS